MYLNAKSERKRSGKTLKAVADEMFISPQALSLKLNGKRLVTVDEARRFKKIIGSDMPLEILFKEFEEGS